MRRVQRRSCSSEAALTPSYQFILDDIRSSRAGSTGGNGGPQPDRRPGGHLFQQFRRRARGPSPGEPLREPVRIGTAEHLSLELIGYGEAPCREDLQNRLG